MDDNSKNNESGRLRPAGAGADPGSHGTLPAHAQQQLLDLEQELAGCKQMLASLRSSQAITKALLMTPLAAVCVLDCAGCILDLNETAARGCGLPKARILGAGIWDFLPEPVASSRKYYVDAAFTAGDPLRFEDEREGVWTDTILYPVHGDDRSVTSVVVVSHDITHRKQAEQELRRSKKMLEKAQQLAVIGNWEVDAQHGRVQWSDELYRILGYEPGAIEASVESFVRHLHPDDRKQFLEHSSKDDRGEYARLGYRAEYRLIARDGSLKWVTGNSEAEYSEAGSICRISGTVQDITERRQMEDALRENEQKFRGLFLCSGEGIILCDSSWRIIGWNKALEHITGRPEKDVLNRDASDMIIEFFPPEHRTPELHNLFRERLATFMAERDSVEDEFTLHRDDGSTRVITYAMCKIPIGQDCLYGAILRDITDIRRSEEQTQRLGRIVEESLNEIYILDARTLRFLMANRGARDNLGYSMQELRSMTPVEVNAGLSASAIARLVAPLRSGEQEAVQLQTLHRRKDGSTYPVEMCLHRGSYNDAEVLVAHALDTTQRMQAEEAVRKSEERFRAIFNNAGIGIGLVDREGRYVQVNTRWADMLGYSMHELLSMRHVDVMHADDRDLAESRIAEMQQGEAMVYNAERRFVRKDGTVFWVDGVATPLPDGQGGIEAIIGMAADITDRKTAERERERLITELTDAAAQIKTLKGLLPICSSCKKIRDDKGYWNAIENYIMEHSDAEFTHGICPDCIEKNFPEACEPASCSEPS